MLVNDEQLYVIKEYNNIVIIVVKSTDMCFYELHRLNPTLCHLVLISHNTDFAEVRKVYFELY